MWNACMCVQSTTKDWHALTSIRDYDKRHFGVFDTSKLAKNAEKIYPSVIKCQIIWRQNLVVWTLKIKIICIRCVNPWIKHTDSVNITTITDISTGTWYLSTFLRQSHTTTQDACCCYCSPVTLAACCGNSAVTT